MLVDKSAQYPVKSPNFIGKINLIMLLTNKHKSRALQQGVFQERNQ